MPGSFLLVGHFLGEPGRRPGAEPTWNNEYSSVAEDVPHRGSSEHHSGAGHDFD